MDTRFLLRRAARSAPSFTRFEVGAGEARRAARDHLEVHLAREWYLLAVDGQYLFASLDVGHIDHHLPVEAAGAQKRRVEHVGPVGRGDDYHALVRLEAVHFHQELVQRLLAFVVPAAQARAAQPPHRVYLVDEDDAGRALLPLLEQVAHARGAHAHEHLHEVGAADGEERHAGLAGDGARQERLSGAGRPHQEHALGYLRAYVDELLWIFQKVDDFLELLLRLVHARDVQEGDLVLGLGIEARAALAERHRLVAGALDLTDHEEPDEPEEEEPWQELEEPLEKEVVVGLLALDLDAVGQEHPHKFRVLVGNERLVGGGLFVLHEDARYLLAVDHHRGADTVFPHQPHELAVFQLVDPGLGNLAEAEERHPEDHDQQQ